MRRLVAVVGMLFGSLLSAQDLRVEGRVMREQLMGEQPVPRTQVTLHRVGGATSGPIDSMLTDARGRYAFRVASPDTAAMYLATSRWAGIAYFAPPVATDAPAAPGEIHVFDTTSRDIRLRHVGRHIVVAAPDAEGQREIVEVWELANDTLVTRVARDGSPAFTVMLPGDARRVRSTQGDFAGTAVRIDGSRVDVVAPVAPGIRQLVLTYDVPPQGFPLVVRLPDSTGVVEVLLEEAGGSVSDTALRPLGAVPSEGRTFLRFLGNDRPASSFEVRVPTSGGGGAPWPWLVGLGLASLGAVAWAMRPGRSPSPVVPLVRTRGDELRATLAAVERSLADPTTPPADQAALTQHAAALRAELGAMAPEDRLR